MGGMIGLLLVVSLWIAGAIGYIWNIVKLVQCVSFGGLEIVRAIGILVPPVGAITGWF